VSGEEEAEQGPHQAYRGKYFFSLAQILSVQILSVALTTSRSRMRKNQFRAFLTLSHQNGDDRIEGKRFLAH